MRRQTRARAVRRERNLTRAAVSGPHDQRLTAAQIPPARCRVAAAANERGTIRRITHCQHGPAMADQFLLECAPRRIEHPDAAIRTTNARRFEPGCQLITWASDAS